MLAYAGPAQTGGSALTDFSVLLKGTTFVADTLFFSSSFSLKGNGRAASRAAAASIQRVKVVTSHPQEDLAVPHTTLRLAHYSPTVCKKPILLRPE